MPYDEFCPGPDVNYTTKCERWHNISLSICSCGYKVLTCGGGIDYRANQDFILCYAAGGEGLYRCGGQGFHVSKDLGYLAVPNTPAAVTAEGGTPLQVYWVAFNGFFAERYLLRACLSAKSPVFGYRRDGDMAERFRRLIEHSKISWNRYCKMLSDLYDIISCLIDDAAEKSSVPQAEYGTQEYVWMAIRYIDAHYAEDITVKSLAEKIGITRKYLYSIFRDIVHVSPQRYLINYRMHRACELLRSHKFTVAQTARAVGYGDSFHFSKMFKKSTGVPPSEYASPQSESAPAGKGN